MNFKDFKYWFVYENQNKYRIELTSEPDSDVILENSQKSYVCSTDEPNVVVLDSDNREIDESQVLDDFQLYCENRPEAAVGRKVDFQNSSLEDAYSNLLRGAIMCRAYRNYKNPDDPSTQKYADSVIEWLESTDFYICPASTRYHESYPSGLLHHSLNVYNYMVELFQIPKFNDKVSIDSSTVCALVHDWCKIGLYESYMKNVKDEKTGTWHKEPAYRYRNHDHPFGHGVTSMWMANRMFRLTESEALAIRWHQGHWNVSINEENEFQDANHKNPMNYLIQFADQLAITEY